MERAYDTFPVHVMVNVKYQRVAAQVGRQGRRVDLVFHSTEADVDDVSRLVDAALRFAGCRRKGEIP